MDMYICVCACQLLPFLRYSAAAKGGSSPTPQTKSAGRPFHFVLTLDNFVKMLSVLMRLQCGIPTIIMVLALLRCLLTPGSLIF